MPVSLIMAECQNTQVPRVSGVSSTFCSKNSILNEQIKGVKMCARVCKYVNLIAAVFSALTGSAAEGA